jgi:hypothetical protein
MKTLLFIVSFVSVGVVWALNRMTTTDLRAQIEVARQDSAELVLLQRERDRLQRLQLDAEERARSEHAAVALAQQELASRGQPAHHQPTSFIVGEWLPINTWRNRGQATTIATVETALWAAGGGDVETLKDMLQLDELVRAKAEAVLARLPDNSRAMYPSAEHLIAAFTTRSIPLGDAQLVWQHPLGPDEAVACVFVKNSEANFQSSPLTHLPNGTPDKVPPMGRPSNKTIATYLSLRRINDSWRLVVPMTAIEKIAKDLGRER